MRPPSRIRFVGALLIATALLGAAAPQATPPAASSAPLGKKLARPPLDPPLTVTGGFGEYRRGHFHAGFDFGTSRRVGRPVRASEGGWVERVRCSGVGYGRSLYIRTTDGRTLQLGHLDAFASAIDRYVRAAQDSTGQYEQDLWPAPNEFPVRAGAVVAWSGQSGAGGPHLHFEIRRGDFAFHPQRAGLVVADRRPPSIPRVTLEPLDASSAVAGGMGPLTITLGKVDTLRAIGRIRAIVEARDGLWSGVDRMVPWAVGISWNGRTTECRYDSVSWATDMAEGDYVHDAGRVIGARGIVLWAPAGYRPRFLRSDAPMSEEAGTLNIEPGDPPRALEIWARDAAAGVVRRTIVLRPGEAPGPARPAWWNGNDRGTHLPGEFAALPGGSLRWWLPVRLAPGGVEFQIGSESRRATRVGNRWHAALPRPWSVSARAEPAPFAVRLTQSDSSDREVGGILLGARLGPADPLELADEGHRLEIPAEALFEEGAVFTSRGAAPGPVPGLTYLGHSWNVEPSTLPLRRSARVTLTASPGQPLDGVGLCRGGSDGWQWLGGDRNDATRTVSAESRQLGTFALFRDVTPPRVALQRAPKRSATKPYSRWALEASVVEQGSGVDARASWLEVDGKRVPTEWDAEARRLRWRPVRAPRAGKHGVLMVATDRAGNTARERGSFRMSR